jgi:hypothetical protein
MTARENCKYLSWVDLCPTRSVFAGVAGVTSSVERRTGPGEKPSFKTECRVSGSI